MEGINFLAFSPIIVALLTGIIAIVFLKKDAEGDEDVDKGFSKNYFRLPYKKRLIINVVTYPVIILIFIIIYLSIDLSPLLSVTTLFIFLISFFAELIYNYKMWQKHKYNG